VHRAGQRIVDHFAGIKTPDHVLLGLGAPDTTLGPGAISLSQALVAVSSCRSRGPFLPLLRLWGCGRRLRSSAHFRARPALCAARSPGVFLLVCHSGGIHTTDPGHAKSKSV
jgi:hypothetical protein